VIAKRRDAPYRSRRSEDWLKIKCGLRQEFVIGGFTEGQGTRGGFGSLMLGVFDRQGALRHVGNVGSGFDARTLTGLHRRLKALERPEPPFARHAKPPTRPHWVEPTLVAEVAFAAWTHGGNIRHGVFVGLREDKEAHEVTREIPTPTDPPAPVPPPPEPEVPGKPPTTGAAGLRVTNPQRVIDRRSGLTKLDLVRHYGAVGELMMKHVRDRPVALMRAPAGVGGERFFQKHLDAALPGIVQLDPALSPGHAPWIAVASARGLLSAAQWNVVEVHTQNATHRRFEQPDRLVFDLDPGEGVAWPQVQEAAQLMHALLDQLGLAGYLKTSGGKGLHVVVPLRPQFDWDTVKAFSRSVVQHMARTLPDRFVAKSGPKNRVGKVFVDYLRNGRGATTVSAWSARARPGMGVSVPVAWSELDALKGGDHWTVRNLQDRLSVGNEPWRDYARRARTLTAAMKRLGFDPEAS
jgi:bifunctional non-homologous end joining protein LigD